MFAMISACPDDDLELIETTAFARANRFFTLCCISPIRRRCCSCARIRSEMSRAIFDAPTTIPCSFLIGDMVSEMSTSEPSFLRRFVSK
jgi:hypothetical protein